MEYFCKSKGESLFYNGMRRIKRGRGPRAFPVTFILICCKYWRTVWLWFQCTRFNLNAMFCTGGIVFCINLDDIFQVCS